MKYTIIADGNTIFTSKSRNAKIHLIEGEYNEVVVVETKTGKFLSRATRFSWKIAVSRDPNSKDIQREKEWNVNK